VPSEPLTTLDFTTAGDADAAFGDLDISSLGPALRGVLFTDGTVTRALEVQTLKRISIEVVAQHEVPVPTDAAQHLRIQPGTPSVTRCVAMRVGEDASTPSVWAESRILPERLPAGFFQRLDGAPHGIGESLQMLKVESWRELLGCDLRKRPVWAEGGADESDLAISRLYRVVTGGLPAILISECFAVQVDDGRYELVARRG
jgi:chorismate-pyruvate lyase